jgi:hypothetical protein
MALFNVNFGGKDEPVFDSNGISSSDTSYSVNINVPTAGYAWFSRYRSAGTDMSGNFTIPDGVYRDINFFVCDQANFDIWTGGGSASVYKYHSGNGPYAWTFTTPTTSTWYIVYDNKFSALQGKHVVGWHADEYKSTYYVVNKDAWTSADAAECGPGGQVAWSFSGTNTGAGIKVMALDSANFLKIKNSQSYSYTTLSDGSYYSASGTWVPTSVATWNIVFMHVGPSTSSTNLTFSATTTYDDSYEQNDAFANAATLSTGTYSNLCCFDDDWYRVYVSAATLLTITMDSITVSDPDLELYNSGQSLLAYSTNVGTTTETITYLTTSSGYYYIRAHPYSGLPHYRLIISTVADDGYEENDIFANAAYISTDYTYNNMRAFDNDWYQVYVSAGTILNVSITISNSQYLSAYLYNSAQSTLASDGSSSSALFLSYLISTTGYYYIQTVPSSGYRPYYSLTTTTASDDSYEENDVLSSAASLSTGTTYYNLKAFDDDWYYFYVNAGNQLNVSLTKYGSGYAYLYLYNPSESLLASWTGSSDHQSLVYHVTTAGYYYIMVDYSSGTSSYDLTSSITADSPPPGPSVDGYNAWVLVFCTLSALAIVLYKGKSRIR